MQYHVHLVPGSKSKESNLYLTGWDGAIRALRLLFIVKAKVFQGLLIGLLLLMKMSNTAQPNDWLWAKGLGGVLYSDCYGSSVEVSVNGNVYTAGSFTGIIDFDPGEEIYELNSNGPMALYISKLDNAGNFVWAKSIGNIAEDYGGVLNVELGLDLEENVYASSLYSVNNVDFDPGPGVYYLSAFEDGPTFILKLNSQGNFIWVRTFGDSLNTGSPTGMIIDRDGNRIYTSGIFSNSVDFNPGADTFNLLSAGGLDIYISALDSQGNFIAAYAMGGLSDDIPTSIDLDNEENIYITGAFEGIADFDPGSSVFELSSQGAIDIFIVKLDMDGGFQFAKSIGGANWESAICITIDTNGRGHLYITGFYTGIVDFDPGPGIYNLTSAGPKDIFISKFDLDGEFVWGRSIGATGGDSGSSIAVSPDGQYVYTTGYFSQTVDFDPGVGLYYLSSNGPDNTFVSKLSGSGDFVWAYAAGGESFDYSEDIAIDNQGAGYITGILQSNQIQFGNTTVFNEANSSSFISKFGICQGVVTSLSDSGHGTLRETISCVAPGSTITFDLPPMTQIILTSGEIMIDKDLILLGPGIFDLTISGNNSSRIFNLLPDINFKIEDLSLKNAASLTHGGAVYTKGHLNLTNVLLQNNFEGSSPKGLTLVGTGRLSVEGSVEIKF